MGLWGWPMPRLLQICDRDAVLQLKQGNEKPSKKAIHLIIPGTIVMNQIFYLCLGG
jgi:hypothetical protein